MNFVRLAAAALALTCSSAWAEGNQPYFGVGLGSSSIHGYADTESTGQLFGGYGWDIEPGVLAGFEGGYMDTGGTSNVHGVWGAAALQWQLAPLYELRLTAGVSAGKPNSGMASIGLGYYIERNMAVHVEFAGRNDVDTLLFNMTFYPGISKYPEPMVY